MSTHNICFRGEIRKILCGYPLLSVAMDHPVSVDCHHFHCALFRGQFCFALLETRMYVLIISLSRSNMVHVESEVIIWSIFGYELCGVKK